MQPKLTYQQIEDKRAAALQARREEITHLEKRVKELEGEQELLLDALKGDALAAAVAARYDLTDEVLHHLLTAQGVEYERLAIRLLKLTEGVHV